MDLFEVDDHAIGAERELQPSAMRLQNHGDALVVLQPQCARAFISQRPSRANLGIYAGQVRSVVKTVHDARSRELRSADAADAQPFDAQRIGMPLIVQRSAADRGRADERDLKLLDRNCR